ncbi:MAG: hypothetical protein QXH10_09245 [Ignisphaera sp.]|uniref:Uncharacterized protein n=1 Tax=Ligamenvirales sp. TaxID=2832923 RepID=A0AAU6PXH4_9VIRU
MADKDYLSIKGSVDPANGKFEWKEAIIDSSILAMISFFTSLAGTSTAGYPTPINLYAAGVSAALQFFTVLALKRGLIKK